MTEYVPAMSRMKVRMHVLMSTHIVTSCYDNPSKLTICWRDIKIAQKWLRTTYYPTTFFLRCLKIGSYNGLVRKSACCSVTSIIPKVIMPFFHKIPEVMVFNLYVFRPISHLRCLCEFQGSALVLNYRASHSSATLWNIYHFTDLPQRMHEWCGFS